MITDHKSCTRQAVNNELKKGGLTSEDNIGIWIYRVTHHRPMYLPFQMHLQIQPQNLVFVLEL